MAMLALLRNIVYGPVRSRRLGRSLGVNLLPPDWKLCNFDCAYCQYGWTAADGSSPRERMPPIAWPDATEVANAVTAALRRLREQDLGVDRITIAGHGEPTLHPDFAYIVAALGMVRDREAPGARIAVLSNSSTASRPLVQSGLLLADERYMKLDSGNQQLIRRLNGTRVSLAAIIDALKHLDGVVVQTMFVHDASGVMDNAGPNDVDSWLKALQVVRPTAVDIYTLDRAPALETLRPVPSRRLEEIAEQVRALGFVARVSE